LPACTLFRDPAARHGAGSRFVIHPEPPCGCPGWRRAARRAWRPTLQSSSPPSFGEIALCGCRRCQGDGQRVAGQHHDQDQPPYCPLAIGVGAEELGHITDGRGVGLDPPAFGGHGGAFRLEGGQSAGRLVSLTGEARTGLALASCLVLTTNRRRPRRENERQISDSQPILSGESSG
jgi:hypothetical protein